MATQGSGTTPEMLLGEIEHLLAHQPIPETISHDLPENFEWFGRVGAALASWRPGGVDKELAAMRAEIALHHAMQATKERMMVLQTLYQARADLRMRTVGPVNVALGAGMPFQFFEAVKQLIAPARTELLFVDPYLNDEFVSRYLTFVRDGVKVRLLADKHVPELTAAVEALVLQRPKLGVEIRRPAGRQLHDRFVFVDRKECYLSGASFKDGAKQTLTTITAITDVFPQVFQWFEDIWKSATVVR